MSTRPLHDSRMYELNWYPICVRWRTHGRTDANPVLSDVKCRYLSSTLSVSLLFFAVNVPNLLPHFLFTFSILACFSFGNCLHFLLYLFISISYIYVRSFFHLSKFLYKDIFVSCDSLIFLFSSMPLPSFLWFLFLLCSHIICYDCHYHSIINIIIITSLSVS